MKSSRIHSLARTAACLLLLAALMPSPSPAAGQKLKAEEVIAKHVEAVGPAETRASIKSRIFTGTAVVTFREPGTGQVGGRAVMASEGEKNLLGMVFDNVAEYPHERFAFDGKDVTVSYVRPGVRSTLGDFMMTYKGLLRQGLLGGVLSSSWPLLGDAGKKGRLEVGGPKKLNERQAYELKYFPKGGSDLRVSIFLDAETFQHVRTEYTRVTTAQMGATPEQSGQQSETRYKLVEDFSDFRKEGGLTLPHVYKVRLEIRRTGGSFDAEWEVRLAEFAFNQRLEPNSFDVDGD
jgi:hypothetical protein